MDKYYNAVINFRITPKVVMWAAFIVLMVSVFAGVLTHVFPESKPSEVVNAEVKNVPYIEEVDDFAIDKAILRNWGYYNPNPWRFI